MINEEKIKEGNMFEWLIIFPNLGNADPITNILSNISILISMIFAFILIVIFLLYLAGYSFKTDHITHLIFGAIPGINLVLLPAAICFYGVLYFIRILKKIHENNKYNRQNKKQKKEVARQKIKNYIISIGKQKNPKELTKELNISINQLIELLQEIHYENYGGGATTNSFQFNFPKILNVPGSIISDLYTPSYKQKSNHTIKNNYFTMFDMNINQNLNTGQEASETKDMKAIDETKK